MARGQGQDDDARPVPPVDQWRERAPDRGPGAAGHGADALASRLYATSSRGSGILSRQDIELLRLRERRVEPAPAPRRCSGSSGGAPASSSAPWTWRGSQADAELGRRLFNASWAGNWGFVPVSEVEMAAHDRGFSAAVAIRLRRLRRAEGRSGRLCAVSAQSLRDRRRSRRRAILARLAQARLARLRRTRGGIGSAADGACCSASRRRWSEPYRARASPWSWSTNSMRRAVKTNVQDLECGWILDDNYAMTSVVQWLGAKLTRRFGVYEAPIPARPTA